MADEAPRMGCEEVEVDFQVSRKARDVGWLEAGGDLSTGTAQS